MGKDLRVRETSEDVASIAGRWLGMATADMAEEFREAVEDVDDAKFLELFKEIRSMAASCLSQAIKP